MLGGERREERRGFGAIFLVCSRYPKAAKMGLSWSKARLFKLPQKREAVRIH